MREQMEFADSEAFRKFMEGLPTFKASQYVHGVFIELHPIWKQIVDNQRASGLPADSSFPLYWPFSWDRVPPGPYDLNPEYFPKAWRDLCVQHNKEQRPFIVTLWILPFTTEQLEGFRSLDQYTQNQPFFVRFQQRPMAKLAAAVEGASEITAFGNGALGGFLQDQHGKHWGVTCGHVATVAGSAFSLEDVGGVRYPAAGTVVHSNYSTLVPVGAAGICNPYVAGGNPDTDSALLELGGGFTPLNSVRGLGTIDEIFDRTRLNSGSPVCMSGVKSRVEDYEIGGYGVTLKVEFHMGSVLEYHCFSHLFQFYDPTPPASWMPAKVAQARLARPLLGDSGSWVCFRKDAAVCAYFGNLIAVENLTGIATFADSLVKWADAWHHLELTVP